MCRCNPRIKSPYCGGQGCEMPPMKLEMSPPKEVTIEQLQKLQRSVAEMGDQYGVSVAAWLIRGMCDELLTSRTSGQSSGSPNIEHQVGDVLFSYIDRLEDQTEEDTAAMIVEEMLVKIRPILAAHFNFRLKDHGK